MNIEENNVDISKQIKDITLNEDDYITSEISEEDIIKQYLADEKTQEQLNDLALNFHQISKGNWIDIEQIYKKSFIKKNHKDKAAAVSEIRMFLDLLIMSKRAFVKNKNGQLVYKITLNKDSRKKLILNQIKEYENAIENLKKELK